MEIKVSICSKLKERNEKGEFNFSVETHETISEEEICDMIMKRFREGYDLYDERDYYAQIDKVTHD